MLPLTVNKRFDPFGVIHVDAKKKHVEVEEGERIGYDRLLVATGGRNRPVSIPGAELDGVLQLRTVEESDRIRARAQRGRKAVVVGLGFIGSEVAASLRQLGVEVTALAPDRAPLGRDRLRESRQALSAGLFDDYKSS
jgi:3-phenylpropionate/trans-cinnamate dioxygenase ferredoxin reductase subunit